MESESTEPTNGPSAAASPEGLVDWKGEPAVSFLVILAFVFGVAGLVSRDISAHPPRNGSVGAGSQDEAARNAVLRALNSEDAGGLERLPGIGPVLARRIVERRPFRSIDELARVPGFGPKVILRLRLLQSEEHIPVD
jgi:DNA uptake protein ComE-like DNA-binding protein